PWPRVASWSKSPKAKLRKFADSWPPRLINLPTMQMTPRLLGALRQLLLPGEFSVAPEVLKEHSKDKWFASHLPDAVVFPKNTASVAKLLAYANRYHIPVTPRGAGHGYVGGCVPIKGGVVLSLAKMDRIKEISPQDFVAVVQPGVITERLQ